MEYNVKTQKTIVLLYTSSDQVATGIKKQNTTYISTQQNEITRYKSNKISTRSV